jgi:hypothetical protein
VYLSTGITSLQNSKGHTYTLGAARLNNGNADIVYCRPTAEMTAAVVRPEVLVFKDWDDCHYYDVGLVGSTFAELGDPKNAGVKQSSHF